MRSAHPPRTGGAGGVIRAWLRCHSLTMAYLALGPTVTAYACLRVEIGTKTWEVVFTGGMFFTMQAIAYILQGPLTERNKPEE